MSDRSRRVLLAVGLVVLLGVAGCLGQDDSPQATSTNAGEPMPAEEANRSQEGPEENPGGPSSEQANRSLRANGSEAATSVSVDLVWATNGAVVRWDHRTQNVSRVGLGDAVGSGSEITSLAWGPEGGLYATTMTASTGAGGTGAVLGPSATVLRVNVSGQQIETVHSGPPLSSPLGLTVLDDGRVLVADRGQLGRPPQGAPSPSGQVVEIGPGGNADVLTVDPRFQGWMDIQAIEGDVYLTTQTDQQMITPTNPDDDGVGAVWTVDASTGQHQLASASPIFRSPSGLTAAGEAGLFVSEWEGARVLQVDPSSGEASVVSPVNGSQNLWGLDTLPDGRAVVADAGGIWLVDPATGEAERLVESSSDGTPRHVRVFGGS